MQNYQLVGSAPPYLKSQVSIERIMHHALIAFSPVALAGVYFFGMRALTVIVTSVVTAIVTEAVILKLRGLPVTVTDGSAAVTGLLLAFTLPPGFPLIQTALGAVFAIAIVKHTFGGLGHNIFNPALAARVFLMVSWPVEATKYLWPQSYSAWVAAAAGGFDAATTATPLVLFKEGAIAQSISGIGANLPAYQDLFIGRVAGSIGETSVLAVLAGGLLLTILLRNRFSLKTPITFIATVAVLTWVLGGEAGMLTGDPLYAVLSGGLLLGAMFFTADIVTSPVTDQGKIILGIGCGVLVFVIREYGKYPEGVAFAILIMNSLTPMIDRMTMPKRTGEVSNR